MVDLNGSMIFDGRYSVQCKNIFIKKVLLSTDLKSTNKPGMFETSITVLTFLGINHYCIKILSRMLGAGVDGGRGGER